jgi:hypothetical protein
MGDALIERLKRAGIRFEVLGGGGKAISSESRRPGTLRLMAGWA